PLSLHDALPILRRSGARKKTSRRPQASLPAIHRRDPEGAGKGIEGGQQRSGEKERRRTQAKGAGSGRRNGGGAGCRARRGGKDLGLDGQAGAQAPQSRIHRVISWLPVLQRVAGNGRKKRQLEARRSEEPP